MATVNTELHKVVKKAKVAQEKLQTILKDKSWIEDARKYAEKQGKEVKKLLANDVDRVLSFLEKQSKELEKIQKQIPAEVKKLKKYVHAQRKEFDALVANVKKGNFKFKAKAVVRKKPKTAKKAATKKASSQKSSA